jgi:predicted trehalose synthase
LIDFEGEPNVPIERRNNFGSPLRDVACMLRSFDYAAYYSLRNSGAAHSAELMDEWLTNVRSAFWRGYLQVHGDISSSYSDALLFFEVEKALFEIDYEHSHRPAWFDVAAESTYRLLSRDLEATAGHNGGRAGTE